MELAIISDKTNGFQLEEFNLYDYDLSNIAIVIRLRYISLDMNVLKRFTNFIGNYTIVSFFILLTVLLGLLVVSRQIKHENQTKHINTSESISKSVELYKVGKFPYIKVQAQIDKAGVITVVAQTGGVVQKIYVNEGQAVKRGNWLAGLSSNYQGASAQTVSRQLAQKQYENFEATYNDQKDLLKKQKDIANLADENSDELAEINKKSIEGTKDLISYNEEILAQLDQIIDATGDLTMQMSRAQFKASLENAKTGLRQIEYQTDKNNSPSKFSELQKDVTVGQINVQEKALDLNREILKLQLDLAKIQESLLYPASPFTGVVQQVFIKKGQLVSPGTPIATILGDSSDITATAYVSKNTAKNVSATSPSIISLDNDSFEVLPSFVSNEATRGTLYSILYDIPEQYNAILGNKEFVMVKVPLGYANDTGNSEGVYIPIDAIHNTQDGAYVLLIGDDCIAKSKKIELGPLYGEFAYIYSGLANDESVIMNRNVVEGDKVVSEDGVGICVK